MATQDALQDAGIEQLVLDQMIPDEDLEVTEITGKDRLRLAGQCLGWLLAIFLIAMLCYIGANEQSKAAAEKVWSDVTKIIPPIVTLVIGYFFGSRDAAN